jgi:ABC-type transport system involved in multi-copper enzyme maturation permease subunit
MLPRSAVVMARPILSDWDQFKVAAWNQVQGYYRTYRFWIIMAIILAIGGGFTIAFLVKGTAWVHSSFGATSSDYLAGTLGFISFLAIVTGAFFGGDAISTDFGTKSGYFTLALPVRRSVLLAGRYTGAFLVSMFAMAVFYAIDLFGGIYFYSFGSVPWLNFGLSYAITALFVLGILSFAFCLSSLSKSPAIGLVITILVLLVVFNIVDGLVRVLIGSQYLVYSILYADGAIGSVIGGISASSPPVWEASIIMAVYAVLFIAIALALYHRAET